jgi:regulator of sigma E protease
MEILAAVLAFILLIVVLVLVHELGHFVAAKLAGITVQEFGIGFPPRLASITRGGTRYSLNAIPLGGFVKMLGEDGEIEAKKLRERGLSEAAIDKVMEGAFNRKPIWVRIAVLLAGVLMNFLLAGVLYSTAMLLPRLEQHGPLVVDSIQPNSPAATAGLQVGDRIVAADSQRFELSAELTAYVRERAGQSTVLTVESDSGTEDLTVVPRRPEDLEPGEGPIGFGWHGERTVEAPPLASSLPQAVAQGFYGVSVDAITLPGALVDAIGGLLGLNPNAGQAVGPIGIAEQTGLVLESPLIVQVGFVAILSLNLAVLNVLPFPPLDGGRIAVVLIEAVRRRRLPAEREALIYLTGFMVLIALVILISIQDVQRLIEG